jgi:DNA polymerase III subunit alpha
VEEGAIRYALKAIKGVGEQAVESVIAARQSGLFKDLRDFAARLDTKAVNKRVLESLIAAGALDDLEPNRAKAYANAERILSEAARERDAVLAGQNELFSGEMKPALVLTEAPEWLPAERLKQEYDVIGFFLSGHPLDAYKTSLERLSVTDWICFTESVKAGATAGRLAGMVVSRTEKRTKTGNKLGIIGFSDASAPYEAVIFSENLAQYRELLEPGQTVLIHVSAEYQGEDVRARIQSVERLDTAAAKTQKGLKITLKDAKYAPTLAKNLPERGDGEITLILTLQPEETQVEMRLKNRYRVSPHIAAQYRAMAGIAAVQEI